MHIVFTPIQYFLANLCSYNSFNIIIIFTLLLFYTFQITATIIAVHDRRLYRGQLFEEGWRLCLCFHCISDMATYGQSSRNRPALYKPTDFGSQQKRLSSVSGSSGSEVKKEEEKVTIKIQQRPHTAPADEKPPVMDNKPVKILKESPVAVEKSNGSKKVFDYSVWFINHEVYKALWLNDLMNAF